MTSCFVYKVMGLTFHDRINTQFIYRFELAQVVATRIANPQRIFLVSNLTGCSFLFSFFFIIFIFGGSGGLILLFSSCLIFIYYFAYISEFTLVCVVTDWCFYMCLKHAKGIKIIIIVIK